MNSALRRRISKNLLIWCNIRIQQARTVDKNVLMTKIRVNMEKRRLRFEWLNNGLEMDKVFVYNGQKGDSNLQEAGINGG